MAMDIKIYEPILATNVYEWWGIDCINMTCTEMGINVEDYFSKFIWARKMKVRIAANVELTDN